MIKPTIGRRVWYWHSKKVVISPMVSFDHHQAFDAGVIFVHSDNLVNLMVTDHAGHMYPCPFVRLLQDDEEPEGDEAYAQWMPYQRAAAGEKPLS